MLLTLAPPKLPSQLLISAFAILVTRCRHASSVGCWLPVADYRPVYWLLLVRERVSMCAYLLSAATDGSTTGPDTQCDLRPPALSLPRALTRQQVGSLPLPAREDTHRHLRKLSVRASIYSYPQLGRSPEPAEADACRRCCLQPRLAHLVHPYWPDP